MGHRQRLIRLLYYLPMERMTKVDENIQIAQNLLSWIVERCYELEEENKKLKEYNRRLKQGNDDLKEQNKKLKAQIEKMSWIWLASAAPMVINKEVKYKPWFKNWMPTYDGSDLFK